MPYDVYMVPTFRDAGPFDNQRTYLLDQQLGDSFADMDDVNTAAQAVLTALEVLTWDQIPEYELRIKFTTASAAPNVGANNNVEAFVRYTIPTLATKASLSVPAWDDFTFDKASNGLLSAAFGTAATALLALLRDVKTGESMTFDFAQSRGIKRGQRLVK